MRMTRICNRLYCLDCILLVACCRNSFPFLDWSLGEFRILWVGFGSLNDGKEVRWFDLFWVLEEGDWFMTYE